MTPELFSAPWFSALASIIVIDLILAGDNAIVIGLAARNVPVALQRRVIVCSRRTRFPGCASRPRDASCCAAVAGSGDAHRPPTAPRLIATATIISLFRRFMCRSF